MISDYIRSITLKRELIDSFDKYPFCTAAVKGLHTMDLSSRVTFFTGENGTGKSTLLEAIAIQLGMNSEGGSRNFSFSTQETHSSLSEYIVLTKGHKKAKDGFFFRSESFYNLMSEIDRLAKEDGQMLLSYGGKSLHNYSHGESSFSLLNNRFYGNGIYLLDELESGLSPSMLMTMLTRISDLSINSQFVIATHSPILLALPGAVIYEFSDTGIAKVEYESTDCFQLTHNFLTNYKEMVKILTRDNESY